MKSITQAEIRELIKKGEKVLIVDVRSQEEYDAQHIPNAVNSTIEKIEKGVLKLEKDTIIVTACGKGGGRSESASNYIRMHYDQEVYFLEGGTFSWSE